MKKGLLMCLLGLGSFAAGMGLHAFIAAGPTQALRDELAGSQSSAAAAQVALQQIQAKLHEVPEQIRQAVAADKTRLEAAFQQDKSRLDADLAATKAKDQKDRDDLEAKLKDMADRLAQATATAAKLNEVAEAQKVALSKDNQYISTLGTKLRAAYAATQNTPGQASMDKLDADHAQLDAAMAQRQTDLINANAAQAQADAARKYPQHPSPAKQPPP